MYNTYGKSFNEFFLRVCVCVHDKHFLQRVIKKIFLYAKNGNKNIKLKKLYGNTILILLSPLTNILKPLVSVFWNYSKKYNMYIYFFWLKKTNENHS